MNKSMRLLKSSRKYHKWLMAFVGLQFVIWSVSGTYMVYFDIDYIHGDTLVKNAQHKIEPQQVRFPLQTLLQQYPEARHIALEVLLGRVVYRFVLDDEKYLVDASSGEMLSPLSQDIAEQLARAHYTGTGTISSVELLIEQAPFELNPAALPAWRVNFADMGAPAIYISARTGQLVGKRHDYWRLFDWMFRFHVMDYDDGGDIDNLFLFVFSSLSILATLFGMVLVYFHVINKPGNSRANNRLSGVASKGATP